MTDVIGYTISGRSSLLFGCVECFDGIHPAAEWAIAEGLADEPGTGGAIPVGDPIAKGRACVKCGDPL